MKKLSFQYFDTEKLLAFIGGVITITAFLNPKLTDLIKSAKYPYENGAISILNVVLSSFLPVSLYLINKFLWKYKIFEWLIDIPNMEGIYEGCIVYTNPISGQEETKKAKVIVKQTASQIKISSFFEKEGAFEQTTSTSIVEQVIANENDTFSLVFTYRNEGTPGSNLFSPHYGTNVLDFDKTQKTLKGHYYTNRNPQTKGSMNLVKTA